MSDDSGSEQVPVTLAYERRRVRELADRVDYLSKMLGQVTRQVRLLVFYVADQDYAMAAGTTPKRLVHACMRADCRAHTCDVIGPPHLIDIDDEGWHPK